MKSRSQKGREAEYLTAMMLWGLHRVASFPSADPMFDLITANGTSIEVKQNYRGHFTMNYAQQQKPGFCDFLVLWHRYEVFIVPSSWVNKAIHAISIPEFKDRWDLIRDYDLLDKDG